MPVTFDQLYTTYSNEELVAILESQPSYQPEAITAATNELRGRGVSQDEYDRLVAAVMDAGQVAPAAPKDELAEGMGIFDDLTEFEEAQQAGQWRKLILFFLSIAVFVGVFPLVTGFVLYFSSPYASLSHVTKISNLFWIALSISSLVLFQKKNRWGWILSFFRFSCAFFLPFLSFFSMLFYSSLKYLKGIMLATAIGVDIILALGIGMALYLLLLPGMKKIYGVDEGTIRWTFISSAIACFITLVYFFAGQQF